ncbi:MAG: LytTR family DNA-binding domain-containing protein [Lachnospiraceae bacterium]|nr:LytTR family DNA-binding domain-containing protein [Lachnospiraceae bacterium]
MLNIAIIEDEQIHTELLSGYLSTWSKEHGQEVSIQEFTSAESFLFVWEERKDFDVLFVDIQMAGMSGIEMAKKVRQRDEDIAIVFTTGITDYMETGYEVEALHYLVKPISMEKIGQCMDKVQRRSYKQEYVLVHGKEETIRISVEKITYVEAQGHGSVIEVYAQNDKKERMRIAITESISEMEKRLTMHGFVRCHRSYLCRIGSIHQIGKTDITLDSGSVIPVSRRLYTEINRAFIEYFRNA